MCVCLYKKLITTYWHSTLLEKRYFFLETVHIFTCPYSHLSKQKHLYIFLKSLRNVLLVTFNAEQKKKAIKINIKSIKVCLNSFIKYAIIKRNQEPCTVRYMSLDAISPNIFGRRKRRWPRWALKPLLWSKSYPWKEKRRAPPLCK